MFTAKDAMATNIITVNEKTSIFDAMGILLEKNITGLPVVSDEGKLCGVVSEKDMLKLLYNAQIKADAVSEFMTKNVTTFNEDDDLIDIVDSLIENHFRRVPILSGEKLVGLISRKDIIRFIMSMRQRNLDNIS